MAGQIWSKPRFCCNQSRLSKIRLCLDGKGDINLKINPWEVTGRLRSVPIPPVEVVMPEKGNEREGILDEAASEPPATLDGLMTFNLSHNHKQPNGAV